MFEITDGEKLINELSLAVVFLVLHTQVRCTDFMEVEWNTVHAGQEENYILGGVHLTKV